jgi:hypothetical protein
MPEEPKPEPFDLKAHKMPAKSVLFDRVLPVLLILLAVVMVVLIVFAVGVVTGVIAWK